MGKIIRKDEFDIAKAIAIWMVVIGHLYSSIVRDNIIKLIWFCQMPIFFFISGYFLYKSTKKYTLKEICIKKVKNLLVPYFIWSMISFIANALMMYLKNAGGGYTDELIDIFLYSRSVWFLIELCFCSIIFVMVQAVARKYNKNSCIIQVAVWLTLSLILPGELFAFYKFKWLFPFLLAGAFCAEQFETDIQQKKKIQIVSLIIFLICSNVLYNNVFFDEYSTFSYTSWENVLVGVLYYGISFLGVIGVFALTHWKKPVFLRRLVCAIGQSSMDIYVIHMLLIKFIFWRPDFSNEYLLYLYVAVYSIGIILLILLLRYKVLKCRLYDVCMGRF